MNTQWRKELSHLNHLMHAYYGHGRHGSDPYRGQGRILTVLKEHPEISQKELTGLLDLRKQSLAELLAKLEQKELITREPLESDRRVMKVTLTDKGKKEAESMEEKRQDKKDVFAELSEADQEVFLRCLDQMSTALEAEVGTEVEHHGRRCHEEGHCHGKHQGPDRHHKQSEHHHKEHHHKEHHSREEKGGEGYVRQSGNISE